MAGIERGTPIGDPLPPQHKPSEPPRQLTAVSNRLTEKGLFSAYTPKGEDPTWYPLNVLHELQGDLDRKVQQSAQDTARAEKFASWKKSVQKIHMAYEIIAFPRFDPRTFKQAMLDLVSIRKNPEYNAPGELKDEERSMLGRLALARGLPFDPEKRTYRYSELFSLVHAEVIVFNAQEAVSGT
jgi:hypothetical protein